MNTGNANYVLRSCSWIAAPSAATTADVAGPGPSLGVILGLDPTACGAWDRTDPAPVPYRTTVIATRFWAQDSSLWPGAMGRSLP